MPEKYKVIILPSSDDEHDWEDVNDWKKAIEKYNNESDEHCASLHEFDSRIEIDAFLEGYNAGVGYLGDGWSWQTKE